MKRYPIIITGTRPFLPYYTQTLILDNTLSRKAVQMATDKQILIGFSHSDFEPSNCTLDNIYETGLLCTFSSTRDKIEVVGQKRILINSIYLESDYYMAEYEEMIEEQIDPIIQEQITSLVLDNIEPIRHLNWDYYNSIKQLLTEPGVFEDKMMKVCSKLLINTSGIYDKSTSEIIQFLMTNITQLINAIKFKLSLEEKTKDKVNSKQYKFWAQEQIAILQNEINEGGDGLRNKILEANLPQNVEAIALEEHDKLSDTPSYSSEAAVIRNYIKWILSIPWNKASHNSNSIQEAERILNESHYGMESTKTRILDFIALERRNANASPATLLLHGLPGTGKTSIASTIAKALCRPFIRISMAGLTDSNKLRGQSRTYVGAMPGDIIRKLKIAQANNAVIQLDEIDKCGRTEKDPMNVLHELLDPDFRQYFEDTYMDLPFDLSRALFILTANDISKIPQSIIDRCKVIAIESYNNEEKLKICEDFIVPKQLKKHNIKEGEIVFTTEGIKEIIFRYTREAGVRQLSERVENMISKAILKIESQTTPLPVVINPEFIHQAIPYAIPNDKPEQNYVGLARGLSYSPRGGDTIAIEVVSYESEKSKLNISGNMGKVMRESCTNALAYIRSIASKLEIPEDFFKNRTLQVNTWDAATDKDGPSAGCAFTTALVSHCKNLPIPNHVAITGEISLQGNSLLVGGIKEKSNGALTAISAYTNETPVVFIPYNTPDYMTKNISGVHLIRVKHVREIWQHLWPNIDLFRNI